MYCRKAILEDYDLLYDLYNHVYPSDHPLKNIDFWKWQYGNPEHGTAYIVMDDSKIYGHVGAYFNGNVGWIINVYLDPSLRGGGWVGKMYGLAREDYTNLAATSANSAGLGLYRNMNWFRYCNLERFISINPDFNKSELTTILQPIEVISNFTKPSDDYYWEQPGIKGILLANGSKGVAQEDVGGFRFTEITDLKTALEEIWELGFKWCDYLSSWNDNTLTKLDKAGWVHHEDMRFPWYLNPVDFDKKCRVTFLSENALNADYICKRYYSDHGRVGSLPNKKK